MVLSITNRLSLLMSLSDSTIYPVFDIYPGLLDSSPVKDDIPSLPQSPISTHPTFDICKTLVPQLPCLNC